MKKLVLILTMIVLVGCDDLSDNPNNQVNDFTFESFYEFKIALTDLAKSPPINNDNIYSDLLDTLEGRNQIPFVFEDSVCFLYYGDNFSVSWAGDFNGWSVSSSDCQGTEIGNTNLWILEKKFPLDARLDYKIVKDGSWILDPRNNYTQMSGFGPNSELRMPNWEFPEETILQEGVNRGTFSDNFQIQSIPANLNYTVQYKVYTPYGYDGLSNLPVIYVTDGHEYADDEKGAMIIVLDNLIYNNQIDPVIAVFIDPREPGNLNNNRRGDEYTANINYANFVANELVPEIDANYKTNPSADARAILGTSLGGWNSAYFGYTKSDIFHLIGIHSPAFDDNIISNYSNSAKLPLKIYMSTGVIHDTEERARAMKIVFDDKDYPLQYKEVNEGHSWGNWRALIDEPLIYFFPKSN
ncbi:alpha/beta hydrolase-fold protein [Bacteroidota bacterium]